MRSTEYPSATSTSIVEVCRIKAFVFALVPNIRLHRLFVFGRILN